MNLSQPTNTIEKVKICIVLLLFDRKLCDLRRMIYNPEVSKLFVRGSNKVVQNMSRAGRHT